MAKELLSALTLDGNGNDPSDVAISIQTLLQDNVTNNKKKSIMEQIKALYTKYKIWANLAIVAAVAVIGYTMYKRSSNRR